MRIVVSAPGRVCLFGEHMDWCGHSVIPAAIGMRVFVEAFPLIGNIIRVESFKPFSTHGSFDLRDLQLNMTSDLRYVGGVLKVMLLDGSIPTDRALNLRFMKADDVRSDPQVVEGDRGFDDLPVQKGLSSSAALCVAVAAAVSLTNKLSSTPSSHLPRGPLIASLDATIEGNLSKYADVAYAGERKMLGVNCGQMDQYASAYGGILLIDCSKEPARIRRLRLADHAHIVTGDTQQPKDTPRILAWLGQRFRKDEKLLREGINGIVEVVSEATKELERAEPSLKRMGELMNLNQHYLSKNFRVSGDCPISPSKLDKLISCALDAGALGAKISGSGGGGCIIALTEDEPQKKAVAEAIMSAGGKVYSTEISGKGVRLESIETMATT